MNHPTPPVLNTSFTNSRASFRDDAQYQSEAAERARRFRLAVIKQQEEKDWEIEKVRRAKELQKQAGEYFRDWHTETNTYQKRRLAVECARRIGIIPMGCELEHVSGAHERTTAELNDPKNIRKYDYPDRRLFLSYRARKLKEL